MVRGCPSLGASAEFAPPVGADEADLERRFGSLRRLYGDAAYARLRAARIAVVGVGGVGSWTAEALARSGVARLVLVDLDHVAESNVNRQVQAQGSTLGQAKVQALAVRIADIHPGCEVLPLEAFAEPENWPGLLPAAVDLVVDACDRVRAKVAIAAHALAGGLPLVCVGAAGGKRSATAVRASDLAETTHDPLLARLRQRLRHAHGAPRRGPIGIRCIHSHEPVALPSGLRACEVDANLACHGYGSSVVVTASFGLAAAGEAIERLLRADERAVGR